MARDEEQNVTGTRTSIKTIMVVEDDVNIGEVLVQAITQETSFFAILVSDGFAALHAVENLKPNLFILDYQLPRMDGIELYDQLHAFPGLAHVPAMMMSAQLPQKELAKREILGMSKPIDLDEFLQTIEELMA